jgi:hypothetical protein
MWSLYEMTKSIGAPEFFAALGAVNVARRKFAQVFTQCDVVLSPTTARTAEPWGVLGLSKAGATADNMTETLFAIPTQYTIPYNLLGTPAISLPLASTRTACRSGCNSPAKPPRSMFSCNSRLRLSAPCRGPDGYRRCMSHGCELTIRFERPVV